MSEYQKTNKNRATVKKINDKTSVQKSNINNRDHFSDNRLF